jgi:glyceraldehyde 3-phosphate dehydrogenase
MTTRVAINGFGRIGRNYIRAAIGRDFDVVAINDIMDVETRAHLFRYDTVMGKFKGSVERNDDELVIEGHGIKMLNEKDPEELPWDEMDVDIVIESTGVFRTRKDCDKHLAAGADKVLLSAPGKGGEMLTVVLGVNGDDYDPEKHDVISNASCTTNCLAPLVKVLDEAFGLQCGLMTTTHAVTTSQRILDMPHGDLRRARAAGWNIIPTTTGAAKAIDLVYPEASGKLDAMAMRVPVMDASIVDMVVNLDEETDVEGVNTAFKDASEKGDLAPYLAYIDEPLVSSDFIGDPHSCSYDSLMTRVIGNMAKVLGWYDNEAGYATRMIDLTEIVGSSL